MNKVIEYIIAAKDKTQSAISSAISRIKNFGATVGRNLANIQAGFSMVQNAVRSAMALMQKSFQFEKMTVGFKTLIGSMDEARAHMKMLQELGNTPPFSLEEFAAASKQLMVMSDGVLGYKKTLELVGDAAAATGNNLSSLSHAVGLAYSMIRDGQPLSRATMQLRQMGVITPEVASKLSEMQQAGASSVEMWKMFEDALRRYNGAMAETEQTAEGLKGALGAQFDNTLRECGEAFLEVAKDGIGYLLEKMKELAEDGSIKIWAEKITGALKDAIQAIGALKDATTWLWGKTGLSDVYHTAVGGVKAVGYGVTRAVSGVANGEGFGAIGNALNEAGVEWTKESAKGYWQNKLFKSGFLGDGYKQIAEGLDYEKEVEEEQKSENKAKNQAEKAKAEEEQRLKDEEEEAQKLAKLEEKENERKAKAEEEARKKAEADRLKAIKEQADAEEKARLKLEQDIAKERQKLLNQEIKDRQSAMAKANAEHSQAQSRLQQAEAKSREAWGWYRDRDSWKAQLQEERDNAEAEKQFEKDFEKLKFNRTWRTDTLNDDDEIVRRVALAREEEAKAKEYVKQTAEACDRTAEAVEAMQKVLESEEA